MSRARGIATLASAALAALIGAASAQATPARQGWRPIAAGDGNQAWLIIPVDAPTLGETGASTRTVGRLHHTSLAGAIGAVGVLRAHPVLEPPLVVTAHDGRLTLIYAPRAQDGVRSHPVRSMRAVSRRGPGGLETTFFDPPDRFAVEPPLETSGRLVAAADTALGLAALIQTGDGWSLSVLTREGWTAQPLPPAPGAEFVDALDAGPGLALLARTDAGAELWTLETLDGPWTGRAIDPAILGADRIALPIGIVTPSPTAGGLSLILHRDGRSLPLAHVDGVGPGAAPARLGDHVVVFWSAGENAEQISLAVVSGVTGETLFRGPARFGPPLTPSDLRLVGFLLSAVMLGVLLFLLKPETPDQARPAPGFAIADLARRTLAGAIDAALAAGVSALVFRVPVIDAIDPSHLVLLDGADSWPVLATSAIYVLHGTLGEWLAGRTAGKAMTGCRVASTRGPRVRLWQALTRNLVKVLVPPLVALVLVDPNRRHTGDLIGGTIVVMRSDQASDQHDAGPEDDQPDDG